MPHRTSDADWYLRCKVCFIQYLCFLFLICDRNIELSIGSLWFGFKFTIGVVPIAIRLIFNYVRFKSVQKFNLFNSLNERTITILQWILPKIFITRELIKSGMRHSHWIHSSTNWWKSVNIAFYTLGEFKKIALRTFRWYLRQKMCKDTLFSPL